MSISALFQEIVRQNANRPAVAFSPVKKLTYEQLDRLSNQAAHYLLKQGFQKGDRLGLCLEKSASFYIFILAALKIGAPYVSFDPRNPAPRLSRMIAQSRPRLILSQQPLDVPEPMPHPLCPFGHELPEFIKSYSEQLPELREASGMDPAYIMFTSGSTGKPKGAVISRDNLMHFIEWAVVEYKFTPDDVHTHLNPVYFDNSVFDIYSTWFSGGELVPFTQELLLNPSALSVRLKEMKCTVWFSVPSLLIYLQVMKVVARDLFGSLQKIIFGGEGYPKVKLKALFDTLGDPVEYYNVSGPTECTCICTSYRVTTADFKDLQGLPPLGSVIPTFKSYVLDGDRSAPEGQTGELCLSGPCVGLGYYAQPELTRQVFVQNPLKGAGKEIIYRTGDLVRLDPKDGKLYFVGRKDLQIKHMGYRVELEEIQHALDRCESVNESAVVYKSQEPGEIIAIVAASIAPDPASLKRELAAHLPKYMVPTKIHFLKNLPKSANGKTDRQALMQKYGS